MHFLVPIIILAIICVQFFFFVKNLQRMRQFRDIFSDQSSWRLRKNTETDLVDGVYGDGNGIFTAIVNSINKYLGNNSGSVIDFGLLKDAVDRHCDSVENDIATQTPIPLYWGLAGTMAGVIIGLGDLLQSDALKTLMGGSGGEFSLAADGVRALLSGVAWAMGASICGIVLTTANSLLFKNCKLKEEEGKNSFLAWMQSELLPELPSDTSEVLNNLVKNLNKFNQTFASNTTNLGNTLQAVNESYATQSEIIRTVRDMDVVQMTQENARVLLDLKECTDKLEAFNRYLDDIKGYTDAIHRFEEQFQTEANRVHVLEEIRDYFQRHKGEIAKTTADADNALKESLNRIKESTSENVNELNKSFVEQCETFKTLLNDEKEEFEKFSTDLREQFNAQMANMPTLARQLEEISSIPARLDRLIEKIENSNYRLAYEISQSVRQSLMDSKANNQRFGEDSYADKDNGDSIPTWMKISGWAAIVIIAIACIINVVMGFFPKHNTYVQASEFVEQIMSDSESIGGKCFCSGYERINGFGIVRKTLQF